MGMKYPIPEDLQEEYAHAKFKKWVRRAELIERIAKVEADNKALLSAVARMLWNFELLLARKPVREAAEAIAEARAAIRQARGE